jgi:hypothetical protein
MDALMKFSALELVQSAEIHLCNLMFSMNLDEEERVQTREISFEREKK